MSETYSKHIHPENKSVRTIFGDGAAATLVSARKESDQNSGIGPFVLGTDGQGAKHLIVQAGRQRYPLVETQAEDNDNGSQSARHLFMNGPEIMNFTLKVVPDSVKQVLEKAKLTMDDIDLFVFHQANQYMLEYLCKKIKIPKEKFYIALREFGNTVSSTIPIALKDARTKGLIKTGDRIMLVGFGVGLSWGAAIIHWEE